MLYENYLRKDCCFLTSPCPLGKMSTCSDSSRPQSQTGPCAAWSPLPSLTLASGVLCMVWVPKKARLWCQRLRVSHSIWACEQRKAQAPHKDSQLCRAPMRTEENLTGLYNPEDCPNVDCYHA